MPVSASKPSKRWPDMAAQGWIAARAYSRNQAGQPRVSTDRRTKASGLALALLLGPLVALALVAMLGGAA